jgi:hypothetical protein
MSAFGGKADIPVPLSCDRWRMALDCCGDRAVYVFWHSVLYVIAVVFIGARQHALIIMGHDASHYRYLPKRWAERALRQSLPDVACVRLGGRLSQVSLDASPIHKPAA